MITNNEMTAAERIRAYLAEFPHAVNLGAEFSQHVRKDGHSYVLDREDLSAVLDQLTNARDEIQRIRAKYRRESDELNALHNAGVDNWEGYDLAMESINEC